MGLILHFECDRCGHRSSVNAATGVCSCGGLLLAQYDWEVVAKTWKRERLTTGMGSMWRYSRVLPAEAEEAVTLEEGWTPIICAGRLTGTLGGATDVWVKDEGRNPTGSDRARCASVATTMGRKTGFGRLALASMGHDGTAFAAYCAAAGVAARIFLSGEVSQADFVECSAHGAWLTLSADPSGDLATWLREEGEGWRDVNSLRELYGVEGAKTLGYEIAEQLDWKLPDAIICSDDDGARVIGMWKAFRELKVLGWIGNERPKIVVAQAERALARSESVSSILHESNGTTVAVSNQESIDGALLLAREAGILASIEGGACVAALGKVLSSGFVAANRRIVLCNPALGMKNLEELSRRFSRRRYSEQDKLGGLITPR